MVRCDRTCDRENTVLYPENRSTPDVHAKTSIVKHQGVISHVDCEVVRVYRYRSVRSNLEPGTEPQLSPTHCSGSDLVCGDGCSTQVLCGNYAVRDVGFLVHRTDGKLGTRDSPSLNQRGGYRVSRNMPGVYRPISDVGVAHNAHSNLGGPNSSSLNQRGGYRTVDQDVLSIQRLRPDLVP